VTAAMVVSTKPPTRRFGRTEMAGRMMLDLSSYDASSDPPRLESGSRLTGAVFSAQG